jgi:tetratricopeptide (TPR) repeat protein
MTPEDYKEEVPRKERTIDFEKFQGIYDTIWERWYKRIIQEQGYWDDQDLIAKVLELKCYRPSFAAIFCDEAQDFTKLELQLIMRLSIFSQYHLGYQPLQSLPFAFAGDPFQTLNPTGFHWSSVQAMFDSEVITALDPADQLKLVINFQELTFNYRSTPPIVEFTNLIQFWRYVLFDIQEIQPQTAWQQGKFPEPQKFIFNQNINPEQLQFYIKDTIIIVPCEEGEESAYVRGDNILSEIFPQLESSETEEQNQNKEAHKEQAIKNVLSAISTKGLEFKKVILYKFGEDCQREIWNQQRKDTDQRVKVEYFFNKLYVAASRATEHLFVIDSQEGDRLLWQHASDEALLQAMVMYSKNRERWENTVKTLSTGNPKTAQSLREDDPGAIAQEFETKGLKAQNPGLLRRAKMFYNDLGNVVKANFCKAWALKFEEQFLQAGRYFLQGDFLEEAWECFWEGMCWSELVSLYEQSPNNRETEYSLAIFMIAQPRNIEAINNFTAFVSRVLSAFSGNLEEETTEETSVVLSLQKLANSQQWKKAIEEYANRIESLLKIPEIKPDEWQKFGEVLETLGKTGYSELNLLAGECFYHAENFSEAVRIWEASGFTQKLEYNRAKATLLNLPESLEYLEKAGEHNTILVEWEKAGKPRDRQWLQFVAPALELKQQYQQAFVVYIWLEQLAKIKECFEKASKGTPSIKLFSVLLQYFYRIKSFGEAREAIEKYLPTAIGSERQKADLKFNLVYQISCSDLVSESLTKEQRQGYENFLKTQVLVNSEWQQYLLMKQLGIALERIGLIVESLDFYEQYLSDSDPELRDFARERWLAIKKKQENYSKKHRQSYKASKLHTEIFKKARSWSINEHSVSMEPPVAPRERLSSETFDPRATLTDYSRTDYSLSSTVSKSGIKGLPSDIKIEQLEAGVVRFVVRHLVIKLMKQSKQILITDVLNGKEVRVDGTQCKVNIGELSVAATNANQLEFSLSTSGYSGSLVRQGEKTHFELDIQGLSEKIYLEL